MQEVMVKTHLIIKDIQDEYKIKWCGSIIDSNPIFVNDKPVFAIVGSNHRIELNTSNMKEIEKFAKRITKPKGRKAFTSDRSLIYIKEADGGQKLVGIVTHNRYKTFAPMYDPIKVQ